MSTFAEYLKTHEIPLEKAIERIVAGRGTLTDRDLINSLGGQTRLWKRLMTSATVVDAFFTPSRPVERMTFDYLPDFERIFDEL